MGGVEGYTLILGNGDIIMNGGTRLLLYIDIDISYSYFLRD